MSQFPPNSLADQIAQLQQRHADMVQQTQSEISRLQQEMLLGGQTQQLQQALAQAEQEKQMLQQQLVATHQQYQEQYQQLLSSFASLKQPHATPQPFQAPLEAFVPQPLTTPAPQPIHPAPTAIPAPMFTPVEFAPTSFWNTATAPVVNVEPVPVVAPSMNSFPAQEDPTPKRRRMLFIFKRAGKKQKQVDTVAPLMTPEVLAAQPTAKVDGIQKKEKKRGGFRRVAVRFAVFALFISGGYFGWSKYLGPNSETGNVAGVQSSATQTSTSEQERYKEAYADIPFEETVWETLKDPDLGITIDWPKNTTNMSRVVGGSNLWFLRKNGYLFRFSIPDSVILPLDEWWEINKATYLNNATESRVTFKGGPAIRVTPREASPTSGTSYYFKTKLGITQVWVKDEPPTTDDGQRLQRMVDSLTFN